MTGALNYIFKQCDSCQSFPAEIYTGHGTYCETCATPDERSEDRDRRETLRDMDATARRAELAEAQEDRERLLKAAKEMLAMHFGGPNAVSNWDLAVAELADAARTAEKTKETQ